LTEWFTKLKELDSLEKMKTAQHLQRAQEQARLDKLKQVQQEKLSLKQETMSARQIARSQLMEVEAKIKELETQWQRLRDTGAEEEKIATYARNLSSKEEEGLTLLESIEGHDQQLGEIDEFLAGLERTMSEISAEVVSACEQLDQSLQQLDLRLGLILEELPEQFRAIFLKVRSKQLAHGPFTRVEAGSCLFCRYKLSRIDESEIDMQKGLKTCNQCGRIFLPYGS
jgi:predicted  nucleic acid-binding Zn-ribbon protein